MVGDVSRRQGVLGWRHWCIYITTTTITMKAFFIKLVVVACALHEGHAFSSILPHTTQPTATSQKTSLSSATIGSSSNNDHVASMPSRSPTAAELREMDTIRAELIDKYIALGHTEEVSSFFFITSYMLLIFSLALSWHHHSTHIVPQPSFFVYYLCYSMPPGK